MCDVCAEHMYVCAEPVYNMCTRAEHVMCVCWACAVCTYALGVYTCVLRVCIRVCVLKRVGHVCIFVLSVCVLVC